MFLSLGLNTVGVLLYWGWRNLVTYALFFSYLYTTGMKSVSGICKGRRVQVDFLCFDREFGSVSGVATRNSGVCNFFPTLSFPLLLSCISDQQSRQSWNTSTFFFGYLFTGFGIFCPTWILTDGFSGWFELVWIVAHFFHRHNCCFSCRLKPFLCLILSMSLNGP